MSTRWLLRGHDGGGSFDKFAVDERGAGADQRDEMRCVDGAPAVLGGFDQPPHTDVWTTVAEGEPPMIDR